MSSDSESIHSSEESISLVQTGTQWQGEAELEKQLWNYKLSHKALQELLRQILSSESNERGENRDFSDGLVSQLLDDLLGYFSDMALKYGDEENEEVINEIERLSECTDLVEKTHSMVEIFSKIMESVSKQSKTLSELFITQSNKINFIQRLLQTHKTESKNLVQLLQQKDNEISDKATAQVQQLKQRLQMSEHIHMQDINHLSTKVRDLENALTESNINNSSKNNHDPISIMAFEFANLAKFSQQLRPGDVTVQSNFNGENVVENNLIETIVALNSKVRDLESIVENAENFQTRLQQDIERLKVDKGKIAAFERNLEISITRFQELLSLDLKAFGRIIEALNKVIDEPSLSQAKEKVKKLNLQHQTRDKYSINYEKIIYLSEAIHHYFATAIETMASEHLTTLIDSSAKERSDSMIINNLEEKIASLTDEVEMYKSQYANNSRTKAEPGGSPRSSARIEELTKRLKSERERRKLDSKASQAKIVELEKENELLRQRLGV